MDPQELVAPASALGYPAAPWFLFTFKVLGFLLHLVPMSLWFAGLLAAMALHTFGGPLARRQSARLLRQMPVIVAFGINFGIVPLLFTQVLYHRVFYPATILMAWPWMSVIALLLVAYYGVYIVAGGLGPGRERLSAGRTLIGWIAALLFFSIGMNFTSAFHLMTDVAAWPDLWMRQEVAGAVLGIAAVHGEPAVLARFFMTFGLALMTTGAWFAFDAGWLGRAESEAQRRFAGRLALALLALGAVWFALFGSWYAFGTWRPEVRSAMWGSALLLLTALTALSPALPVLLALPLWTRPVTARAATLIALAQVVVLALNAVSRQVVEAIELRPYLDVSEVPVNWQTSPLLVFLALFAVGLGVAIWMVAQAARAAKTA